jgi:hypothetical protein
MRWSPTLYFDVMRRVAAILVVWLVALLPAADAVSCPDGCTDISHGRPSLESGASCSDDAGCGLCLNACAVHGTVSAAIRIEPLSSHPAVAATRLRSLTPPAIERPPRDN